MKKIIFIIISLIFLSGCADRHNMISITKAKNEEAPEMKIHYLDIKNGRCAFIELPNGEYMLWDSGSTNDFPVVYEYLRKLGIKNIDYMVISSNDSYHFGGVVKIVNNFNVHEMYVSKSIPDKTLYKNTAEEAIRNSCKIYTAEAGTEILLQGNLAVSIVAPINETYDDYKDFSLSMMITYGEVNYLMMGNTGEKTENDLVISAEEYLDSDLLSVSYNEQKNISSTAFLQKVGPKYSVIQVFDKKTPKKSTIDTMEILGSYVLRTDVNGNIIISSNSKEITGIRTER